MNYEEYLKGNSRGLGSQEAWWWLRLYWDYRGIYNIMDTSGLLRPGRIINCNLSPGWPTPYFSEFLSIPD